MKIAIIGGSGFVGTRLIELWHEQHELKNIDKQQSDFYPEITQICNVLDSEKLNDQLRDSEAVVLLAAEHRDDVTPRSLYYEVNVEGMRNTLTAIEKNNIKRLIFFSSVAIYGLDKDCPDEQFAADPFNDYGRSKWQAEQLLAAWHNDHKDVKISVLRPSVIFGERNRGNVYNLLHQLANGRFLMIGNGKNHKSMAYVGNVVAFVDHLFKNQTSDYQIFNYTDKPDLDMNQLIEVVEKTLNKPVPKIHFPFWLGMLGGYCFDILAFVLHKKLAISSIRVRKFCASTKINAQKVQTTGFVAPFTLDEGLQRTIKFEFLKK